MKKHLSTIILVLILVIGLSLLLYPSFADWWNSMNQSHAIARYDAAMMELTKEDYSHHFDAATAYNAQLFSIPHSMVNYVEVEGYEELLDITGTGIMGYIDIPKINVQLPIYHGTSEGVLQIAVGHIQGTSLPTGGASTHCVLSAHRGLPSARLFTDLDEMVIGDTFTISVFDRLLTYEVDQILIVDPTEVGKLYIVEGEDYCTLVTCTPYGLNTHRLLVRGTRIENAEEVKVARVTADAVQIDPIIMAPLLAAPMLLILFIVLMLPKPRKNRRQSL